MIKHCMPRGPKSTVKAIKDYAKTLNLHCLGFHFPRIRSVITDRDWGIGEAVKSLGQECGPIRSIYVHQKCRFCYQPGYHSQWASVWSDGFWHKNFHIGSDLLTVLWKATCKQCNLLSFLIWPPDLIFRKLVTVHGGMLIESRWICPGCWFHVI